MSSIGWRKWMVGAAFVLVLCATGFFLMRAVRPALYWHYQRDEPIRPWMTVSYVAHSYHVPPHLLFQALGLQRQPHDRRPIREIAREQHRSTGEVIAILQDAIVHARRPYPPPSPPSDPGRSP